MSTALDNIIPILSFAFYGKTRLIIQEVHRTTLGKATWKDSAEGLPPRKYYSLTPVGKEYLEAMNIQWENLLNAMSNLKGE